jgi:hypothetical protein
MKRVRRVRREIENHRTRTDDIPINDAALGASENGFGNDFGNQLEIGRRDSGGEFSIFITKSSNEDNLRDISGSDNIKRAIRPDDSFSRQASHFESVSSRLVVFRR